MESNIQPIPESLSFLWDAEELTFLISNTFYSIERGYLLSNKASIGQGLSLST